MSLFEKLMENVSEVFVWFGLVFSHHFILRLSFVVPEKFVYRINFTTLHYITFVYIVSDSDVFYSNNN